MTLLDLLILAAIPVAFWLLLIRPAKVRRDSQAALVASLAPGQRIMTTAGLFGTVVERTPDRVLVEVAPGVRVEMVPQAVGQIVDRGPAAADELPFAEEQPSADEQPFADEQRFEATPDSSEPEAGAGPTGDARSDEEAERG